MKRLNLKGKRFGRLKVIDVVKNHPEYVICKCECGKVCTVLSYNLTKTYKPTRSCGCLRSETSKKNLAVNTIHNNPVNKVFGTVFNKIENNTVNKNNKTGYRGVYYIENSGKYKAYIGLHRKLYHLGIFKTIEEAVEARREAEEEMYAPLIAKKNTYLAEHGLQN